MLKIGLRFIILAALLTIKNSSFTLIANNQPTAKRKDAIASIQLYINENPRKAINLANSTPATTNIDTLGLIATLKANAFLTLGKPDSAILAIDSVFLDNVQLSKNTHFEIVKFKVSHLVSLNSFSEAIDELNKQQKEYSNSEDISLNARIVILKAEVYEQQKEYQKALMLLKNGLTEHEKQNATSINVLFYRSIGSHFFKTGMFTKAIDWYNKALSGYNELNDTLNQISILKNISLANRGLSQFEDANSDLLKAQSLAIANDSPEELADIYNLLGSLKLRSGKPTEALEYYEQSLILREDLELLSSTASTLENVARVQRDLNEFDKALNNLLRVIEIRQQLNDKKNLASAYNELGNLYAQKQSYADALMNYLTSLKIRQEENLTEDIARSLTNIGLTYRKIGSYSNALNYLEQAIELIGTSNDPLSQAYIYVNHGNTLRDLGRAEDAIESYQAALKLRKLTGNKQAIAQANKSLAYAYGDIKQFDKAQELLYNALNISKEVGDDVRTADIYNELGNLSLQIGDYEEAVEFFQLASTLYAKHFDLEKRALCIRKIGEAQTALGQYQNAFIHLELALSLANKTNNLKLKELTLLALYEYHQKKGEYKDALTFYTEHISLRDSLNSINKQEAIWQASLDLELNKKVEQIKQIETEVESLRTEAKLKTVQLEQQKLYRKFISLILLFVAVIAGGSIYGYFIIRNKNKHLGEANEKLSLSEKELKSLVQTKDRLFSIIAHDLRSPFTALLGLTEVLAKQELNPAEVSEFGQHLHQSSQKLLTLIENLLQWSRSQTGKIKLEPKEFTLAQLVSEIVSVQQMQANTKSISIDVSIDKSQTLIADYDTIATVIRNLLSNAIKFTPEKGSITVSADKSAGKTTISITDTGVGMSTEETQRLFSFEKSFSKQGTNQEAGTGLGLIICKEFVEMNGGKIEVHSAKGMGTTFNITLP